MRRFDCVTVTPQRSVPSSSHLIHHMSCLLLSRLHTVELHSCLFYLTLPDLIHFAIASHDCAGAVSHPHVWREWERRRETIKVDYLKALDEAIKMEAEKEEDGPPSASPHLRLIRLAPLSLTVDDCDTCDECLPLFHSPLFTHVRQLEIKCDMSSDDANSTKKKEITRILSQRDTPFRRELHTLRIRATMPRPIDVTHTEDVNEQDALIDQMVGECISGLAESEGKGSALTSLHIGMTQARLTNQQARALCKLTNLTHLSFDTGVPLSAFEILCSSSHFQRGLRSLGLFGTTKESVGFGGNLALYETPLNRLTSLTALHVEGFTIWEFTGRVKSLTQLSHILITHRQSVNDSDTAQFDVVNKCEIIEDEMPQVNQLTISWWQWDGSYVYEPVSSGQYSFRMIREELQDMDRGRISVCLQRKQIIDQYEKLHTYDLFDRT